MVQVTPPTPTRRHVKQFRPVESDGVNLASEINDRNVSCCDWQKNSRFHRGRHPTAASFRRWWWDCWDRRRASRRSAGQNTGFECGTESRASAPPGTRHSTNRCRLPSNARTTSFQQKLAAREKNESTINNLMTFLTTVLHILQTILQFTAAQHISLKTPVCVVTASATSPTPNILNTLRQVRNCWHLKFSYDMTVKTSPINWQIPYYAQTYSRFPDNWKRQM